MDSKETHLWITAHSLTSWLLSFLICLLPSLVYAENPCGRKCVKQVVKEVLAKNGGSGSQGPAGVSSTCTLTGGRCLIFVTYTRVQGDMNTITENPYGFLGSGPGIDGGNAICQAEGTIRFGAGRTFVAWLSDSVNDIRDNISYNDSKAYINDTGATVFGPVTAPPGNIFTSTFYNTSSAAGSIDASGNPIWTGTLNNGTASANHCNNWTGVGSGELGTSNTFSSTNWTQASDLACNTPMYLYCVETGAKLGA